MKNSMNEFKKILDELEPLFEKAEKEDLWFYCSYQNLWFSPDDLRKRHKNGQYIWSIDNWELRDPKEKLAMLEEKKIKIQKEIDELKTKLP